MTTGRMTYEEMEARLYEAEGILVALRHHEVDAIVGDSNVAVVRLREVEEALHEGPGGTGRAGGGAHVRAGEGQPAASRGH